MTAGKLLPSLLSLFDATGLSDSKPSSFWRLFMDETLPSAKRPAPPCACVFDEHHFYWALRNLPLREAAQHLAIIGTTGSGKTTLIRLFLQSIARRFRNDWQGPPEQLVIFDGKTEIIPILAGLDLTPQTTNLHLLNPYDKRGVAWTLAEGVQEPALALNLASIIVPEEPGSNAPFWASAARNTVFAAILGLNQTLGQAWTLRDLIFTLDSKDRLRAVTRDHSRARAIADRVLHDDKHVDGILSHVGTRLVQLEPLAALWHTTLLSSRFNVQDFLSRPGVLVLGGDPALEETLRPINALLLRVMSQEIIRGPSRPTPRTWFVLDEFAAMGRVEAMPNLLRLGRSKGASVLLGIQNIEGLNLLYGPDGANDLLSLCTYKTFLRAGGPDTARWAESYFGQVRRYETQLSENWGKGGYGWSRSYDFRDRALFLASVFLNIPIPAPGKPFVAVHDLPCFDNTVVSHWRSDLVFSMVAGSGHASALEPRSNIQEQTLLEWTPEEEALVTGTDGAESSNCQGEEEKNTPANNGPVKPPDPSERPRRRKRTSPKHSHD